MKVDENESMKTRKATTWVSSKVGELASNVPGGLQRSCGRLTLAAPRICYRSLARLLLAHGLWPANKSCQVRVVRMAKLDKHEKTDDKACRRRLRRPLPHNP